MVLQCVYVEKTNLVYIILFRHVFSSPWFLGESMKSYIIMYDRILFSWTIILCTAVVAGGGDKKNCIWWLVENFSLLYNIMYGVYTRYEWYDLLYIYIQLYNNVVRTYITYIILNVSRIWWDRATSTEPVMRWPAVETKRRGGHYVLGLGNFDIFKFYSGRFLL